MRAFLDFPSDMGRSPGLVDVAMVRNLSDPQCVYALSLSGITLYLAAS